MPPKIDPMLGCMPWNVKQKIVEDADTRTKITLRQCTKEFKTHVEKSIIEYNCLAIGLDENPTRGQEENASIMWTFPEKPNNFSITFGRIDKVTERFFSALKISSKVHLKTLTISICFTRVQMNPNEFLERKTAFLTELVSFLSGLKEKLHVERLSFQNGGNSEEVLLILPLLKPGTLKTIVFSHLGLTTREMDLNAIAETDQWKQATSLILPYISFQLPFPKWKHFNEINIMRSLIVSVETLQEMMEHFIASPNFKHFKIWNRVMDCRGYLQYFLRFNPSITAERNNSGQFDGIDIKIETGESLMKIRVNRNQLLIEKVKRIDYIETIGEDVVRLDSATLLANYEKYI